MKLCIYVILFFRAFLPRLQFMKKELRGMFPGQGTGEGSRSLPLLPPWQRAKTKVPFKRESSTRTSGLLDQRVELREIMHMTCSYIHDSC